MSIKEELERERKELILLSSDAYLEHTKFDDNHLIGTNSTCHICQIFNQIQRSDKLIVKKLELIHGDNILIKEFNELREKMKRLPDESEFKKAEEAKKRFGSWYNFLLKVMNA